MNIIDQIKEAPQDSAVIAKFEGLVRRGSLSEKQIAYGRSLLSANYRAHKAETADGAARTGLARGTWVTTPNTEDGECSVWEVIGETVTVQTEDCTWLTYTVSDLTVVA